MSQSGRADYDIDKPYKQRKCAHFHTKSICTKFAAYIVCRHGVLWMPVVQKFFQLLVQSLFSIAQLPF